MLMKLLQPPHIRGSSPFEFTNGLHDNLDKMNLGSNSIAQPHTILPTTEDLRFNLGDRFQPTNVNFSLDYQLIRAARGVYPKSTIFVPISSYCSSMATIV